jgi:hypothetical protein
MLAQLFSSEVNQRFIIPMELITSTTPLIAALIARRSLTRDPAGQIALGWGISTVGSLVKIVLTRVLGSQTLVAHRLELLLVTACLLYGMTTWIDGVSRRTRWLVVGGWCVAWAFTLPIAVRREFVLLTQPVQAAVILAVSGLALASRVRDAETSLARADWFWILTGHITYFSATLVRMPLQESLVQRHWDLGWPVHFGIMFVYSASYLVVARGMLLNASDRRPTSGGFPLTRPA